MVLMKNTKFLLLALLPCIASAQSVNYKEITLDSCIKIALEKNKQRETSAHQVNQSKAQLKQALSAKLPQFDISSFAYVNDENLTFAQPPLQINMPPMNLGTMILTLPQIEMPSQHFTLSDNKSLLTEANLLFPIYTGGKISSLIEQAKLGIEIAQNDVLLTDREIKYNVKNMYYTVILTQNIKKIFDEALTRFETTFKLTESLYNAGSEQVTRLDFLKNKMTLETFRGFVTTITANLNTAYSALKFYMGVDQNEELTIVTVNYEYNTEKLENFLQASSIIEGNGNLQKINNAVKAFEFKVEEANSDYYPSVAFVGNFRRMDNSYHYGTNTKENQNIFTAGIGLKWSLFNGYRTEGKVEEAEAELHKYESQRDYLKQGLLLQKQKLANELNETNTKILAAKTALESAVEYRELQLKAYLNEMTPVSEFIESQLFESFLSAQYENALFSRVSTIIKLEELFGDIQIQTD